MAHERVLPVHKPRQYQQSIQQASSNGPPVLDFPLALTTSSLAVGPMGQPRWPKPGPHLPTSPLSLPLLIPLLTVIAASIVAPFYATAAPAGPQDGTDAAPSGSFRLTPSALGANDSPTLLPTQPQPASPTLPPTASNRNGLVSQVRVGTGTAATAPAAAAEAVPAGRGTGAATPSATPTQRAGALAAVAAAAGGLVNSSASGGGRAASVSVTGGQQLQQQQPQGVVPSGLAGGSTETAPAGPGTAAATAAAAGPQPAAGVAAAVPARPTADTSGPSRCKQDEDASNDYSYDDGDDARPAAVVVAAAAAGCARPGVRSSMAATGGIQSSGSAELQGAEGTDGTGQQQQQQVLVPDVGRLRSRFWVGLNLGNVPLFPLSGARLQQGEQELRGILQVRVLRFCTTAA